MSDNSVYYICPRCGHAQRSQARDTITCHQCGKRYVRRTAKTIRKHTEAETAEFMVYRQRDHSEK